MESLTHERTSSPACNPYYPPANLRFEWLMVFASLWILSGLLLDGWAHNNIPEEIDSFFTPFHMVLYSGLAVAMTILGVTYLKNKLAGHGWLKSLPQAYMVSLLGAIVFATAGSLDFIWHSIFGFEDGVEALLSPSHLSLAFGGVMIIAGPFRSVWTDAASKDKKLSWRALLSLFSILGIFTFFTQFSNAFSHPHVFTGSTPAGDTYLWDVTLASYILIPAVLFMGFILTTILRWELPKGSLTFLLAGNSTLMFLMTWKFSHEHWQVLIGAFVGGVTADILLVTLKPSAMRVKALRWFSFLTPSLFFLLYFLSLLLATAVWWKPNLVMGAIVFSGVIGLGLSWLAVPPVPYDTREMR
ncbi:MAG: hypothetical protein HY863_22180 [Chloroflexi bacterium]|nr:hypothetical protein [Chloroflexota bacterium]